jgi:signal transduction histidine kinase
MNTLFARLSIALLVIVGLMGAAFYVVDRINTGLYYEELSQTLNAPIAMYVTGQRQLITNGEPDIESLQDLAGHAMVINPTAEIYLLDTEGNILGHGMDPATVLRDRVDLAPVLSLIAGPDHMPVRGDDPRSEKSRKIFSAHPVESEAGLEGYLYVILGGQTYEALASNIEDSYVGRMSAITVAVIVVLTLVVGLLVFGLLTRRLKRLDREMRHVSASKFEAAPKLVHTDGGDEIDALTNAFIDMSDRIAGQIEQLKENDRLRRELVSNISHDLRTPLSAMQGYIETLIIKSESMSAAERDKYLRIARKHTVRLATLIGDLFELSKLDSASVTPNLETFSLPELVQDIAHEFQLDFERKNIRLSVDSQSDTANTIGDIGLIQRVLENLVRNAVKFTPEGGEITISIAERPEALRVAVSDNGPGIHDDDIPRIFDRFYRAVDGEEARSDSSGLGLAIVKRILDLHGSRITVTSRLDAGTRFEFDLPISRQAA